MLLLVAALSQAAVDYRLSSTFTGTTCSGQLIVFTATPESSCSQNVPCTSTTSQSFSFSSNCSVTTPAQSTLPGLVVSTYTFNDCLSQANTISAYRTGACFTTGDSASFTASCSLQGVVLRIWDQSATCSGPARTTDVRSTDQTNCFNGSLSGSIRYNCNSGFIFLPSLALLLAVFLLL